MRTWIWIAVMAMAACKNGGSGAGSSGSGGGSSGSGSSGSGSSATGRTGVATPRPDWRGDLAVLARELPSRHVEPFADITEAAWRAEVAALDAKLDSLDDAQAMAGLTRLVALLGDGHTAVQRRPREAVPLRLYDFSDGIHVIGGGEPAWLGATVTAVGGTPIADVRTALAAYIAHDNAQALRNWIPQLLLDAALLHGAGLVPTSDRVPYTLRLADGTSRDVTLEVSVDPAKVTPPAQLPRYLQKPRLPYWNDYDAATHTLYFAYNQCVDATPPFADFVDSTMGFVLRNQIDHFVIDLRRNGGGNSDVIAPLLAAIAERPELKPGLYAIIGRETYSSAVLNAIALKRLGATLVGEPTGGAPSHHGEVKTFTLPSSGLVVSYSTKFFSNPDVSGDAVAPDVAVAVDYAAWAAGRDPVMEAIVTRPPR